MMKYNIRKLYGVRFEKNSNQLTLSLFHPFWVQLVIYIICIMNILRHFTISNHNKLCINLYITFAKAFE